MTKINDVLVIGGSGFIGTQLVRRLVHRADLRVAIADKVPSRSFPNHYEVCDVRSLDQLRQTISERSIIINLAAEHRDDVQPVSLYDEVNVGGAINICAVAREKGVNTIIFTSSVAVYGFAPIGTDESGEIAPFNDYGRTKHEAEIVFRSWQAESPDVRTLVIVRPTVVFGEGNRGNVYNLFRQIASGAFVMVGDGENRKSIAYVDNVAAFLEFVMNSPVGVHVYNFSDKPDFSMNELVKIVRRIVGRQPKIDFRVPFAVGVAVGRLFDLIAFVTRRSFALSSIRVSKFCADSVYSTAVDNTGFVSPIPLASAIEKTVRYEFLENRVDDSTQFLE